MTALLWPNKQTSRQKALQGFHSDNMLILVDEASGVPDVVFQVGEGAMSTPGAKTVLTGNPTRSDGFFYEAFHSNRDQWHNITVSCEDADTVDEKFIANMEAQYGRESSVFGVRVLGTFLIANQTTFCCPYTWLKGGDG